MIWNVWLLVLLKNFTQNTHKSVDCHRWVFSYWNISQVLKIDRKCQHWLLHLSRRYWRSSNLAGTADLPWLGCCCCVAPLALVETESVEATTEGAPPLPPPPPETSRFCLNVMLDSDKEFDCPLVNLFYWSELCEPKIPE